MRLDELLLDKRLLTQEQLSEAKSHARTSGRLDQSVIELGFVPEEDMLRVLGESMGMEVVSVQDAEVGADVLGLVNSKTVFKQQVFPLERRNGSLVVATNNPFDLETIDEIGNQTGLHVEPVLAPRAEIATAIKNHFGVGGETVGALVGDAQPLALEDNLLDSDEAAEEASVIKLVNEILHEAIEQRTSDVHIEPTERGLRIRYRIDGLLQVQMLPPEIHRFRNAIVSRLKIMARLNIAEKRLPQDGRIQLRVRGREVDVRVSIIPMTFGEGVVLRLLDKSKMKYELRGIGMSDDHYGLWRKLIEMPHGILLVTGPTGSGKSTTLYCALQEIARDDLKIITVEDPVEYQFERIQQIQVHSKIGLTFASSLRAILRHDPDVVLIGEIRDLETAEIAVQASLTGHLVFSTLHTNDAASAFTRLTDMGVEPFLVASTVEAVLAQRLVRTICPNCNTSYRVPLADLPADYPNRTGADAEFWKGAGCRSCNQTGYRGRRGIFELLPVSDEIRHMVTDRKPSTIIKQQALAEGLVTLRADAWRKTISGQTTLDELLRVTKSDLGVASLVQHANAADHAVADTDL
jgi:general secretion pathway protein E/type IV pilus assembly protein PilB